MMPEFTFAFPLEGGLHARPATGLRERALAHDAQCELVNERTRTRAKLGNLLSLLATDTRKGDPCRILADGAGAATAVADLEAYLQGEFLDCDTPGEAPALQGRAFTALGRILLANGTAFWQGIPVAPGVGSGPAVLARSSWAKVSAEPSEDPAAELAALRQALGKVRSALSGTNAILDAQAAMLQDEDLVRTMEAAVTSGLRAPAAMVCAMESAQGRLQASTNPYLRERALDLRDLGDRLLAELTGVPPEPMVLPGPCVVVAAQLTPSRLLAMDRTLVKGLVLADGAATSHTAILARSFGIPCVVCPDGPGLAPGKKLTVDGDRGLVVAEPPPALDAYYAIQDRERSRVTEGTGDTADQQRLALHANILSAQEGTAAFLAGAEGIGLFRTEMLFLDREAPPSEEEQYQAYREILEAAGGKPVVLRLLDVGGDKPLPYLPLPREANPFLGRRGVRWYSAHPEVVRTQIQAAVRAAGHGNLHLMIPMVAEAEEIQAVRAMLKEAGGTSGIPLGIMVEVPAAALNLEALAKEVDFFCVGTNDLVQYLFASDRGDALVAKTSHDWHPATLRVLARIVEDSDKAGVPLSLCGEMASSPALLPLLVGLGFRSLSMAPGLLREARRTLASLDTSACRSLAESALRAGSSEEVAELLRKGTGALGEASLTDPDLMILDEPSASKEEAIKLLAERLAALGRARDPLAVEEAIWAREATYATGVGFGFAVPHCKTPDVTVASLAVLRLAAPLDWGSLDDLPVDFLVLLATDGKDGGQEHLRVFARLARKLMDEQFRAALRGAATADALQAILETHVLTPL